MKAARPRRKRAIILGSAEVACAPAFALPAALPALLRAAKAMPSAASAHSIQRVLEAHLPKGDAQAASDVAAELLACALSGAPRPVPLLRMASIALHLAAQSFDYTAWKARGFPHPDFEQDHRDDWAWAREHAGPPA